MPALALRDFDHALCDGVNNVSGGLVDEDGTRANGSVLDSSCLPFYDDVNTNLRWGGKAGAVLCPNSKRGSIKPDAGSRMRPERCVLPCHLRYNRRAINDVSTPLSCKYGPSGRRYFAKSTIPPMLVAHAAATCGGSH